MGLSGTTESDRAGRPRTKHYLSPVEEADQSPHLQAADSKASNPSHINSSKEDISTARSERSLQPFDLAFGLDSEAKVDNSLKATDEPLRESPTTNTRSGREGRRRSRSMTANSSPTIGQTVSFKDFRKKRGDDTKSPGNSPMSAPSLRRGSDTSESSGFYISTFNDNGIKYDQFRMMEARLSELQRALAEYRALLQRQEAESTRISLRYTRSIPFLSNLLMGLWVFWTRFLLPFRYGVRSLSLALLLKSKTGRGKLLRFLIKCALPALPHGIFITSCGVLMSRDNDRICVAGFLIGSVYCLTLAVRGNQIMAWSNYFFVLINALCLVARFFTLFNGYLPSIP